MSSQESYSSTNHPSSFLSGKEIREKILIWIDAWNHHDLDKVMEWFHDDVEFIHWDGSRIRKRSFLKHAWRDWFIQQGDFHFDIQDILADEESQKASFTWTLSWPSRDPGYEGKDEIREGVDLLHFQEGKIISKQTFTKTLLIIDGSKVLMKACK